MTRRDGHGDPRGYEGTAAPGGHHGIFPRQQIEPGVPRSRVGRQGQVGVEPDDGQAEHGVRIGVRGGLGSVRPGVVAFAHLGGALRRGLGVRMVPVLARPPAAARVRG